MDELMKIAFMASTLVVNTTHGLYYFRLKTRNPVRIGLCYLLMPLALPPPQCSARRYLF